MVFVSFMASSTEFTVALSGTGSPISMISFLNKDLSSAFFIVSMGVPSGLTLYLSSMPASASSTARLSPVCPPIVGSKPSGRSLSIILTSTSAVSGSM